AYSANTQTVEVSENARLFPISSWAPSGYHHSRKKMGKPFCVESAMVACDQRIPLYREKSQSISFSCQINALAYLAPVQAPVVCDCSSQIPAKSGKRKV